MRKRLVISVILILVLITNVCVLLKFKEGAKAQEKEDAQTIEPIEIKISAVGDIMLGRYVATLIKDDYDKPFEDIKDILQESDIRFGNLECVLSDDNLECMRALAEKFLKNKPRDKKNSNKTLKSPIFKGLCLRKNKQNFERIYI